VSQRIPLNQNRRVTGTTEILELCKDMLRLEHGIGNVFDMDTAEFTEFRAQFLADFAQIPLIIGIDGRSGTGKTSLAAQLEQELTAAGHSVHVLHLDDFYPGWDGLFDGVEAWDALSVQLTEGIAGTYTPWDWEAGAPREGRTADMIRSIPELVAYVSTIFTLLPGDVVLTGTPAGVGEIRAGQRVEVEVEGIGSFSNPVVRR